MPSPAASASADTTLEESFGCCHGGLVSWVATRTRDPALAEDIAAEAFERLLVTVRAGREPTDRRAWLRRVSLNLVISRVRRDRVAERHVSAIAPPLEQADPTLEEVLERERWAACLVALAMLPAQQRALLLMAASGTRPGQIAATLGTRPGAARTRLHRARRALVASAREDSPPAP